MKQLLSLFLALCFFGCSSTSIEKDVLAYDRISDEEVSSGMPNFYLMDYKFDKSGRKPASLKIIDHKLIKLSNRKLYFMTLYSQHLWLGEVLSRENEVGTCPAFHHEVVSHGRKLGQMQSFYQGAYLKKTNANGWSKRQLPYFPEYALSVDGSREVHTVNTSSENVHEFVKKGLNFHYDKNVRELQKLCETGRSDNYYIFENLSNHFLKKPDFHYSAGALKALLKTPIFSNMLLFQSMLGDRLVLPRAIASYPFKSYNDFEEEVFERVKVSWVKNYFFALKNKRASQFVRYYSK